MRGDGNCLFRTFSYVLFGVQSYHDIVRDKVVDFIKQNKEVESDPAQYMMTSPPQYLMTSPPQYLMTSPPQYLMTSPPQYMMTSPPQYLMTSNIQELGTWRTEIEILTFATIFNMDVYVYVVHGSVKGKPKYVWLRYKPIVDRPDKSKNSVCMQNIYHYYEPVVDVAEKVYSRTPYKCIQDFVPDKCRQRVSSQMLNSALVNSEADAEILREQEKS